MNGSFAVSCDPTLLAERTVQGFDRGCVKTQFNVHLLRSSTRVLRVVDQIEAVSSLRSNLKALNARKRGQFDA